MFWYRPSSKLEGDFWVHSTYKINDDNYKVMLNYSDGGYNRGVENHPGGSRNNIGSFKVGDFVKFRLILDFEKKRWTSILNNTSSSAYFDDYYDNIKAVHFEFKNHINYCNMHCSGNFGLLLNSMN